MKYFLSIALGLALIIPATTLAQEGEVEPVVSVTRFDRAKVWVDTKLAELEEYRIEQAAYFKDLRIRSRFALGISSVARDGTPILPGENEELTGTIEREGGDPWEKSKPMAYATMIYSTGLASLFGTKPLFYVVLIALVLVVLRQLFRWLF